MYIMQQIYETEKYQLHHLCSILYNYLSHKTQNDSPCAKQQKTIANTRVIRDIMHQVKHSMNRKHLGKNNWVVISNEDKTYYWPCQ